MRRLTDAEVDKLHTLLDEEIGEFGYTRDVTPTDWVELELAAVREVHRKVLEFEQDRGAR